MIFKNKFLLQNSPLRGDIGLAETDVVIRMNDCAIRNQKNWHDCIARFGQEPILGYCVDETFVKVVKICSEFMIIDLNYLFFCFWFLQAKAKIQTTIASSVNDSQCCESQDLSSGHLCFKHFHTSDTMKTLSCLPGRDLINNKIRYCQTNADCSENIFCMSPLINNSKV